MNYYGGKPPKSVQQTEEVYQYFLGRGYPDDVASVLTLAERVNLMSLAMVKIARKMLGETAKEPPYDE